MLKSTRRQGEMGRSLTPGVNGQRGSGGNIAIGTNEGKGRERTGIEGVNGKSGIWRAKRSCWTGGTEVDGT